MDETSIATQLFNHSHCLYQLIFKYLNRRNMSVSYMTQEGYDKLRTDLEDLKRVADKKLPGNSRSQGKRATSLKMQNTMLPKMPWACWSSKINEMERHLANARIISETDLDASKVTILSSVTIRNVKQVKTWLISWFLSLKPIWKTEEFRLILPLARVYWEKPKGDIAKISTPAGEMDFEIVSISLD